MFAAESFPGPWRPSPKLFKCGTHRASSPEETLARLGEAIRASGITRIGNVTGLDQLGIPVVSVCRPTARSLVMAQGKGLTFAAAKASAIAESLERWAAEFFAPPTRFESYEQIRRHCAVIDPDRLPRLSNSRYNPDRALHWVEAINLATLEPRWLPFELVHLDKRLPGPPGSGCFPVESNGLATGNTLTEALVHALCEVVERDAITLWRLRPTTIQDLTRVDVSSISDPRACELIAKARKAGVEVAIWDATSDLGAPTFLCRMFDVGAREFRPHHVTDGAGCHLHRDIALTRAISEAAQVRLTLIAGTREDLYAGFYRDRMAEFETLRQRTLDSPARRRFDAAPSFDSDDSAVDLRHLMDGLARRGIKDVFTVDLSRPDLSLNVVRVIVPELEDGEDVEGYQPRRRALSAFWGAGATP
jgi:YcaO-like protein with predicted kinase domain